MYKLSHWLSDDSMEHNKSEEMAYVLWFSKFSNLIGESEIPVHPSKNCLVCWMIMEDRIKTLKVPQNLRT